MLLVIEIALMVGFLWLANQEFAIGEIVPRIIAALCQLAAVLTFYSIIRARRRRLE